MSDDVVIDGSMFFRARRASRASRPPRPPVYSVLLLAPDVSIGELLCALRFSGLDLTTDAEGRNVLHRKPQPPSAA
jgi:hypothetical protein